MFASWPKRSFECARLTSTIIANHSGQSFEQVEKDVERDRILTPHQAKEYGLIDEVIEHREK